MSTTRSLDDYTTFAAKADELINELRELQKTNPAKAKREAKAVLIKTGIATQKGTLKKKIVSWE